MMALTLDSAQAEAFARLAAGEVHAGHVPVSSLSGALIADACEEAHIGHGAIPSLRMGARDATRWVSEARRCEVIAEASSAFANWSDVEDMVSEIQRGEL